MPSLVSAGDKINAEMETREERKACSRSAFTAICVLEFASVLLHVCTHVPHML